MRTTTTKQKPKKSKKVKKQVKGKKGEVPADPPKKRGRPKKVVAPPAVQEAAVCQPQQDPWKVVVEGPRWKPGTDVQTAPSCVVGELGLHYGKVVDHAPGSNFVRIRWDDGSSQCHHISTFVLSDGKGRVAKSMTKEEILEELRLLAELENEK